MSRTITPAYRVEVKATRPMDAFCWNSRQDGRPNAKSLIRFVETYNASFQPGGVNEHCGPLRILSATLIRQSDGEPVAFYAVPQD